MKRKELIEKLSTVKQAQGKNKLVMFSNGKLFSSNDLLFASTKIDSNIECCVESDKLLTYLKKIKQEDVELTLTDSLNITGGRAKASFKIVDDVLIDIVEVGESKKLPDNFSECIKNCLFNIGKFIEKNKQHFNGVSVNNNSANSTDMKAISTHTFSEPFNDELFIPEYFAKQIPTFKPEEVSIDGGWISFINGSSMISCRTLDCKTVDMTGHLKKISGGIKIEFNKDILNAFSTCSALLNDEICYVGCFDNVLTIEAEYKAGMFEESFDFDHEDFEFKINPVYIEKFLKGSFELCLDGKYMRIEENGFINLISVGV